MKGLPKFDLIGSFAVSEDDAFLPDVEPAQLKSVGYLFAWKIFKK